MKRKIIEAKVIGIMKAIKSANTVKIAQATGLLEADDLDDPLLSLILIVSAQ